MFVALVGLMATAGAARAEDAPAAAAPAAAPEHRSLIGTKCKDDAAKLCSGVAMGGGKLARCLRLHENDLSEPCKAALTAAGDKKGATAAAATAAAGEKEGAAPPPPPARRRSRRDGGAQRRHGRSRRRHGRQGDDGQGD